MMVTRVYVALTVLNLLLAQEFTGDTNCLTAANLCFEDPSCSTNFRTLQQCLTGNGVQRLEHDARNECMNTVLALQSSPLSVCKCKKGMKKEKRCLRIYWTMHQSQVPGYNDFEASPYEYSTAGPSWGLDFGRLAALVSASETHLTTRVNHCLDAAKVCNVDETCKHFRTEYAKFCMKPSSRFGCNKSKCHKCLRRFFDRVPVEYSYTALFCPCEDSVCAERRRQTIVPACSFEEPEKQNCLSLQEACNKDVVCRSRLADFQTSCQPSKKSVSFCFRESYATCLQSYTGLIGTILTPNYVSNTSLDTSIWCSCTNSGNQHEECENFLNFFTNNSCLKNSIHAYSNSSFSSLLSLLTTTQRFPFNIPNKEGSNNDAGMLFTLETEEDCEHGSQKQVSQGKELLEKIIDCKVNSGTNGQSLSATRPFTITSLYTFMAIVANVI
ncbi:GDNF family receptor alpha-4 isoform X2 [Callorhinchus milii]|uniref:GDNF family receptor alpha-4 isoform X2 n=1 Tax=Callorhinchus milii TaxID=7868 RepID=UPI00045736BF|nr:GDNF family receptor alpha-4 isoform X2 [Callorhinchus milii]|eukprot:gi/632948343/ref/XP_007889554.1/ PREDICTED: GDNF family receptor alpha-3 isoform X2 [Callorhinchus milii]